MNRKNGYGSSENTIQKVQLIFSPVTFPTPTLLPGTFQYVELSINTEMGKEIFPFHT